MKKLGLLCIGLLFAVSCSDDDVISPSNELDQELEQALISAAPNQDISHYMLPESDDFANIPQDARNPITPEKVLLGQMLFNEPLMLSTPNKPEGFGTASCASCHHSRAGFQACLPQGIGEGGTGFGTDGEGRLPLASYATEDLDIQPIRSPSAMNAAYQEAQLWNGQFAGTTINAGTESNWTGPKEANHLGYEGVETQAIAGSGVHNMHFQNNPALVENAQYVALWEEAFPEVPLAERYTDEYAGLAIAAFERTILSNRSPFQQWLRGDKSAMSDKSKRGATLFFGKANCASCHNGPALNDMNFYALGMKDLDGEGVYGDGIVTDAVKKGRGGFTGNPEDDYKFKTPQLYNLADSPFYGHGASFKSIREVVEYKNIAQPENEEVPTSQLAEAFVPLQLTQSEIDDITEFLYNGLYDPNLARYDPTSLPSGACFPNNDPQTKADLGCE